MGERSRTSRREELRNACRDRSWGSCLRYWAVVRRRSKRVSKIVSVRAKAPACRGTCARRSASACAARVDVPTAWPRATQARTRTTAGRAGVGPRPPSTRAVEMSAMRAKRTRRRPVAQALQLMAAGVPAAELGSQMQLRRRARWSVARQARLLLVTRMRRVRERQARLRAARVLAGLASMWVPPAQRVRARRARAQRTRLEPARARLEPVRVRLEPVRVRVRTVRFRAAPVRRVVVPGVRMRAVAPGNPRLAQLHLQLTAAAVVCLRPRAAHRRRHQSQAWMRRCVRRAKRAVENVAST